MVDPLSLTAVGALALTEGVKFLYAQAGELLKYRRERKQAPELRPPADVLAGSVEPAHPNDERLEELEPELTAGWHALAAYAQGIDEIDPTDPELRRRVDDLRRALEVVYGQRITLQGEARPPSGPLVENDVRAARAKILDSRIGGIQGIPGGVGVRQDVDVTDAEITGSDIGQITFGSSEEER
jgi:hypothetical protein